MFVQLNSVLIAKFTVIIAVGTFIETSLSQVMCKVVIYSALHSLCKPKHKTNRNANLIETAKLVYRPAF